MSGWGRGFGSCLRTRISAASTTPCRWAKTSTFGESIVLVPRAFADTSRATDIILGRAPLLVCLATAAGAGAGTLNLSHRLKPARFSLLRSFRMRVRGVCGGGWLASFRFRAASRQRRAPEATASVASTLLGCIALRLEADRLSEKTSKVENLQSQGCRAAKRNVNYEYSIQMRSGGASAGKRARLFKIFFAGASRSKSKRRTHNA